MLGAGGLDLAVAVVGQRVVDLARLGVHGAPFGAVHLGGAYGIGRQPCVDQHVGLVGKGIAGIGGNGGCGDAQLHPVAGAVGVELGHIKLARVQVFVAGGNAVAGVGVGSRPSGCGDKLVDVLTARVVALVHRQRFAFNALAKGCAFMGKAAQRRALLDGGGLAVGVDFDDVAEGVELVAVVVNTIG